ncbi:DUF397 domain-containing protein [Streptomyces sp. NPDC051172]|uniref:DUF397 domain-containing protein n=1 Tax=Streptomyces sp. NPDC051172 TaxID=3155796 RepID=UPI00341B9876
MQNHQDLTGARWRKSSYSGDTGGDCVEVADLAPHTALIAVRDSKNPPAGVLTLSPAAFSAFLRGAVENPRG